MNGWISKNYPIGKRFVAPDPDTNAMVRVTVQNHYTDLTRQTAGVVVSTNDRKQFSIHCSFLNEDGSGLSR